MSTEWPRMVYHKDGQTSLVQNEEHEKSLGSGWSREPSDIHRQVLVRDRAIVAPVEKSGRDDLAETIARRVVELLNDGDDYSAGIEPGTAPRRRGRPPNTLARNAETRNIEPEKE